MIRELGLALAIAQSAPAATVKELEQIEQQIGDTWRSGDCAGWGALLAPEWSVIHLAGNVITKAQALEMCKAPRPAGYDIRMDELSFRVYGDAAVVTGRTTATTGGANAAAVTIRFTDIFVKRDGRWRVVASQATRLGQ